MMREIQRLATIESHCLSHLGLERQRKESQEPWRSWNCGRLAGTIKERAVQRELVT